MDRNSRILGLFLSLTLLISCKKGFEPTTFSSEEIGRFIAARVPAMIDVTDPVRIRFAVPVDSSQTAGVFSFNPAINGEAYWEDDMTLAFRPTDGWQPGQAYQLQINLDKVIKEPDPKMPRIVFEFEVKPVRMMVSFEPLVPEFEGDTPSYLLRGRVNTSVNIDSQKMEKILEIKTSGKMSPIIWFHNKDGRIHDWVIDRIAPDAEVGFSLER